ncbi:hypothetical protein NA57DRAFT_76650 [Rhizodiscina lignyota]|uniref:Uncharacterized protein n=1 Tax=Rhizodiscina lignyota TaxID=1504668 RepID=A0A9P4M5A5_9PEZI|nr:hypothetical protein NA57DRAFT_76650 [Rhizodiscina lignyota]
MPPKNNRRITDFWRRSGWLKSSPDEEEEDQDTIVVGAMSGKPSQPAPKASRLPRRRKMFDDEVEGDMPPSPPRQQPPPNLPPEPQSLPRTSTHESTPNNVALATVSADATMAAAMQPPPPSASFTSSLTTLPGSLVSISSTSTKRISRDGIEAVRNSDTDSDDSDSSLEDIGTVLAKASGRPRPVAQPTPRATNATSVKSTYRFNLAALVASRDHERAAAEEIALVDSKLKERSPSPSHGVSGGDRDGINEEALAEVIDDDEEAGKARRVLQAMQRTEAFAEELGFSFFDPSRPIKSDIPRFPASSLPSRGWASLLRQPGQRKRTLTSGSALAMCRRHPLPDEILAWMIDAACTGSDELFSYRLVEILGQAQSQIISFLDVDFIHQRLKGMGAQPEVLDPGISLQLSKVRASTAEPPPGLRWLLELIRILAPHLPPASTDGGIILLTRLSLDDKVRSDGLLSSMVHDTIGTLIEEAPGADAPNRFLVLAKVIFRTTQSPVLQLGLIQNFPAALRLCHRLRRQLALAFAMSDKKLLEVDFEDGQLFDQVIQHLQHLSTTTHKVDYTSLGASIAMLDIAIDSGFSNRNFEHDKDAERSFNNSISAVAKAVRELESRLIGGGMNNLSKTAAKAALDRLWYRLQYAVRTKPPVQSGWLDSGVEEQERRVQLMNNWVKKAKEGPPKKVQFMGPAKKKAMGED